MFQKRVYNINNVAKKTDVKVALFSECIVRSSLKGCGGKYLFYLDFHCQIVLSSQSARFSEAKLEWDQVLPTNLLSKWQKLSASLLEAQMTSIPQRCTKQSEGEMISYILWGFCDANHMKLCTYCSALSEGTSRTSPQLVAGYPRDHRNLPTRLTIFHLVGSRVLANLAISLRLTTNWSVLAFHFSPIPSAHSSKVSENLPEWPACRSPDSFVLLGTSDNAIYIGRSQDLTNHIWLNHSVFFQVISNCGTSNIERAFLMITCRSPDSFVLLGTSDNVIYIDRSQELTNHIWLNHSVFFQVISNCGTSNIKRAFLMFAMTEKGSWCFVIPMDRWCVQTKPSHNCIPVRTCFLGCRQAPFFWMTSTLWIWSSPLERFTSHLPDNYQLSLNCLDGLLWHLQQDKDILSMILLSKHRFNKELLRLSSTQNRQLCLFHFWIKLSPWVRTIWVRDTEWFALSEVVTSCGRVSIWSVWVTSPYKGFS